jgi:hypothetical protein
MPYQPGMPPVVLRAGGMMNLGRRDEEKRERGKVSLPKPWDTKGNEEGEKEEREVVTVPKSLTTYSVKWLEPLLARRAGNPKVQSPKRKSAKANPRARRNTAGTRSSGLPKIVMLARAKSGHA